MTGGLSTRVLRRAGRAAAPRFHLPVLGFYRAEPALLRAAPVMGARVRQGRCVSLT